MQPREDKEGDDYNAEIKVETERRTEKKTERRRETEV